MQELTPTTDRSVGEKVVTTLLIVLGVAVMIGIQSLFLTHVQNALPQDSTWRWLTVLCFMAPPVMVGLLAVFKLNYSRSAAQDWILTVSMGIELVFFAINVIVAVNAENINGTLLGFVGLILGGLAGLVSVGAVAFTLAADPVRAVHKQSIINHLELLTMMQQQHKQNITAAMKSDRVRERTAQGTELFVMQQFGGMLGQQLYGDADATRAPKTLSSHSDLEALLGDPARVEELIARGRTAQRALHPNADFLADAPTLEAAAKNGHSNGNGNGSKRK